MGNLKISPLFASTNNQQLNPHHPLRHKLKKSTKKITVLLSEKSSQFSDYVANSASILRSKSPKSLKIFMNKYFHKSYIMPGVLVLGAILVVYLIGNVFRSNGASIITGGDGRISVNKAKAKQEINKEFLFPIKDEKGQEVSKLKFGVQSAELRDELVVKGQKATAIKGRIFLIINIKITNDFNKAIAVNSRDYFRLIVSKSSEKLAPDIHNDDRDGDGDYEGIEVQAISTKPTRVGFPLNEDDKDLILQVGEISGNKQNIVLNKLK